MNFSAKWVGANAIGATDRIQQIATMKNLRADKRRNPALRGWRHAPSKLEKNVKTSSKYPNTCFPRHFRIKMIAQRHTQELQKRALGALQDCVSSIGA
jgi:hypothetical protein